MSTSNNTKNESEPEQHNHDMEQDRDINPIIGSLLSRYDP